MPFLPPNQQCHITLNQYNTSNVLVAIFFHLMSVVFPDLTVL